MFSQLEERLHDRLSQIGANPSEEVAGEASKMTELHQSNEEKGEALDATSALEEKGIRLQDLFSTRSENYNKRRDLETGLYQVHNFEVEKHHTYIADDIRVHNKSALDFVTPGENVLDWDWDHSGSEPRISSYTAIVDDGFGTVTVQVTEIEGGASVEVEKSYVYQNDGERIQLIQVDTVEIDPETGEKTVVDRDIKHFDLDGMRIGSQILSAYAPLLSTALMGDDPDLFQQVTVSAGVLTGAQVLGSFAGGLIHHSLLEADTNGDTALQILGSTLEDAPLIFLNSATNTGFSILSGELTKEIYGNISVEGFWGDVAIEATQVGMATGMSWIAENTIGLGSASPAALLGIPVRLGLNELVPGATSLEGQIGSITGSLLTTTALTPILGPFAPLVGTAVGHFVGLGIEEFGKWFADTFFVTPREWARIAFGEELDEFYIAGISTRGGTDGHLAKGMGEAVLETINYFTLLAEASSENYSDIELPTLGHIKGRIKSYGGEGETFATAQLAILDAALRTLIQMDDLSDGNMLVARILERANINARYENWQKFSDFEWVQDASLQLARAEEGTINIVVEVDPEDFLSLEYDVSSDYTFDQSIKKLLESYFRAISEEFGQKRAQAEIEKYKVLFEELPGLGSSGQLVEFGDLDGFLQHLGADWISSPQDILADVTSKSQIAKDYSEYLQNTALINALMSANPETALTAGWIATLAQAEALQLNERYEVDAIHDGAHVLTADGSDKIDIFATGVVVSSFGGDDLVHSREGHGVIKLGTGDDHFRADVGGNFVDGETGHDEVDHSGAADAVFIRTSGLGNGGAAAGNTYRNVEVFNLTAYDDVIINDAEALEFVTQSGNDLIVTGAGDTSTEAGSGDDTVAVTGPGKHKVDLGRGSDVAIVDLKTAIESGEKTEVVFEGFDAASDTIALVNWEPNASTTDGSKTLTAWSPDAEWQRLLDVAVEETRGTTVTSQDGVIMYFEGLSIDQLSEAKILDGTTYKAGNVRIESGKVFVDGLFDSPFYGETINTRQVLSLETDFGSVGDSQVVSPDYALLTTRDRHNTGIVNTNQKIDFGDSFSFEVEARFGANELGGDGISIVFHADPRGTNAIGHGGADIATDHIQNGLSIELDVFDNGGNEDQVRGDHVDVHDTQTGTRLTKSQLLPNLEDGQFHNVKIDWDADLQTVTHSVDGVVTGSFTADVVSDYLGGNQFVHIGIGAATGKSSNVHTIRNVSFDGYWEDDPQVPMTNPDEFKVRAGKDLKGNLIANNGYGIDKAPSGELTLLAIDGEGIEGIVFSNQEFSSSWTMLDPGQHNEFLPYEVPKAVRLSSGMELFYYTNGDIYADASTIGAELGFGDRVEDEFIYTVVTSDGRTAQETAHVVILGPLEATSAENSSSNTAPVEDAGTFGTIESALFKDGINTLDARASNGGVEIYINHGISRGVAGRESMANFENIIGTDYNDRLVGDTDRNIIAGLDGDDVIKGKGGADHLDGGAGNDKIRGGSDADFIVGGFDADILIGLAGDDTIEGGSSQDFVYGGRDNDRISGGTGNDVLRGNRGDDTILGEQGHDDLRGGGGDDTLIGGSGEDYLLGEGGRDVLDGGSGDDVLVGSADGVIDVFVFATSELGSGGWDRIRGFEDGTDKIDLTAMGFGSFDSDVADRVSEQFGGTLVDFENGDVIFIEGFLFSNFDANDVLL